MCALIEALTAQALSRESYTLTHTYYHIGADNKGRKSMCMYKKENTNTIIV